MRLAVTFAVYELVWTVGCNISVDGKWNSGGNTLLKWASSKTDCLQMNMQNLRIRDDTQGHNREYQLEASNEHLNPPDSKASNADIWLDSQLRISSNVRAIQGDANNMEAVSLTEI